LHNEKLHDFSFSLSNISMFKYVVNPNLDSSLAEKYTLPSNYPSTRPDLQIGICHWLKSRIKWARATPHMQEMRNATRFWHLTLKDSK